MTRDERVIKVMKGFDKTDFRFDTKKNASVPFSFKYSGDEKIQAYSAGCGCTSVTLSNNEISGLLSISDTAHGEIIRTIDVYIDDGNSFSTVSDKFELKDNPEKAKLALRLIANVS